MEKTNKLHFRTNVLLKSIIGKDLITDDNIAVLELVKNSFDALSKTVNIYFQNLYSNTEYSSLTIQDFGKGMNEYDIENKWLNIAYSEKKANSVLGNRNLAGNKGVGRFSCDRLGEFLNLYTKTQEEETINFLHINWNNFEVDDNLELNIQDIDLKLEQISIDDFNERTGLEPFSSGTILEIQKLRKEWGYPQILSLKNSLEKLINPNQAFSDDRFKIEINVDEIDDSNYPIHQKVNGEVRNRVFEELNFKTTWIETTIDPQGEFIDTKLFDKGIHLFSLRENNPYILLKSVKVTIYYLNTYSKAYFTRQTGIRSFHFGSIFLFINGFRIPPYGDDGDDWLNLEARKGQGYGRHLGTRELLGRIEILDKDGQFKIISSRSGVVNNDVYTELTKENSPYGLYYKTHRRLERYVVEGLKWDSAKEKDENILKKVLSDDWDESQETFKEDDIIKTRRALKSIIPILGIKKDDLSNLSINEDYINGIIDKEVERKNHELNQIIENLNDNYTFEDIKQITANLRTKINEVQNLSTDISTTVDKPESNELSALKDKLNETLSRLGELETQKRNEEDEKIALLEANKKLEEDLKLEIEKNTYLKYSSRSLSEDAKGLIHNIKITAKNIQSNVHTLIEKIRDKEIKERELLRRLEVINFNSEKALKISKLITRSNFKTNANTQIVDVVKYLEQYVSIYADIYENSTLAFKINNNTSKIFEKRLSVLELSLVIDDLISNSEKAGAKQIQFDVNTFDKNGKNILEILVSDDGRGLEDKFLSKPDRVFELGVTTTEGSGIGLHTVRNALNQMQAKIFFSANKEILSGATFKIEFTQ